MKTKIVQLTRELMHNRNQASKVVAEIAAELEKGKLIIYPTDTMYAIGADATNDDAIKQIYELKQRSESKAIPVIVSDRYMAEEYFELNDLVRHLMNSLMPGPLSLIASRKADCKLAPSLSGAGVAFRISSSDFARAIASELGKPIASTSANISGSAPLYDIDEVKRVFEGKVAIILDAGNLPPTPASTIIDLQEPEPKIVREGPINGKEVLREIAEFQQQKSVMLTSN